jgi:pimeloyl-ACP methyl ester carboxylesterase
MKIYCFSGLGADKRAFRNLKLETHTLVHIDWIPPLRSETLKDYAARIKPTIEGDAPFAMMGLSFGGMIAVEAAKDLKPQTLIIISSIVVKDEMPVKYKLAGIFRLHKILPFHFFKEPNRLTNYFFGARTAGAKRLLKEILVNTDFDFLKWAIGAMLGWKNTSALVCTRIHGTQDHILPIQNLNVSHVIEGGGHFMILEKADQVSQIIVDTLDNES